MNVRAGAIPAICQLTVDFRLVTIELPSLDFVALDDAAANLGFLGAIV
jgi:hypothetical protein